VRLLWDDGQRLTPLGETSAGPDGSYQAALHVPDDAAAGTTAVCAIASGGYGSDRGCTELTVLPIPLGSISGSVVDRRGLAVANAEVRLITSTGAPLARVSSDASGRYLFTRLLPDDYRLSARCPSDPTTSCATSVSYFPVAEVALSTGAVLTQPLNAVAPPADGAAVVGLGGIALPGGALSATAPVRVTTALSGMVARFGSFSGRGLAPLSVRFWADVDHFNAATSSRAVRFEIFQGNDVLAARTASAAQPVFAADPTYSFSAYVADFNVNDLPPGELTLRITPLLGTSSATPYDVTLDLVDLPARWFHDWIAAPVVTVTPDSPTGLLYTLNARLPQPPLDFDQVIDLQYDVHLDNLLQLNVPLEETFHSDGTWEGRAPARLDAQVLGIDVLGIQVAYDGPSGDDFFGASYHFGSIHGDRFGKQCIDLPPLSYRNKTAIQPCPGCMSINLALWFQTQMCVQAGVDVDSQIDSNLHLAAQATPQLNVSPTLEVKLATAICGGSAKAEPQVMASLPIVYDGATAKDAAFVDPCLRIGLAQSYDVHCLGINAARGTANHPGFDFGCAAASQTQSIPAGGGAALQLDELSPSPAVSAEGNGHALALWLGESNPGPLPSPNRFLFFSVYDGTAWSAAARVSEQAALMETPQVAFIGGGHAVAVWVQSSLTFNQALAGNIQQLLASSELYFALWDGSSWTTPAPLTNDALWDAAPSLAADATSGTATVAWVRQHSNLQSIEQPVSVYAARFDGIQWEQPVLIGARSASLDYQPSAAINRSGLPAVAWVRDVDGDVLTNDRQLIMAQFGDGGWGAPEVIPMSRGAYTPSLAFDSSNAPIVAFVVPPNDVEAQRLGSGNGNISSLFTSRRLGGVWSLSAVGAGTRAEHPVVRVASDDYAVVMFRGFSFDGGVHLTGDLAAATADLRFSELQWATGFLSNDGLVNWEVAADVDASTATTFVANVKKQPGQASGQVTLAAVPYAVDLAVSASDIVFSDSHPLVGDSVTATVTVHNIGLKPTGNNRLPSDGGESGQFRIHLYDGDTSLGAFRVFSSSFKFNSAVEFPFTFTLQSRGLRTITAVIDESSEIAETSESNNSTQVTLGEVPLPRNLTSIVDNARSTLTLRWDAAAERGIQRYEVYRSMRLGSGYELVGGSSGTQFVDSLAEVGVTYRYVVQAIDIYGTRSSVSNESTAAIAAPVVCTGDCNGDGEVTIDELLTGVNIALGGLSIDSCPAFDSSGDGEVTIDELLAAVLNALNGCPK
jgi:hypothetical protein